MPLPGHAWFHVIWGTNGSWLPGDARGFRSRGHRVHSTGDYRSPPPPGEHEGLRRHALGLSKRVVRLDEPTRTRLVAALAWLGREHDVAVSAVAVAATHAHLLLELGERRPERDRVMRQWKSASSRVVRQEWPGRVWSRGEKVVWQRDRRQVAGTFRYILRHRGEAAVWCFRDTMPPRPEALPRFRAAIRG